MIRIDAIWLATEPMHVRAGTKTALARVIAVFGACAGTMSGMTFSPNLDQMTPEQHLVFAAQALQLQLQLQSQVEAMSRNIHNDETIIEQLTYEITLLKSRKFAKRSEQISPAPGILMDDLLETDLEAIEPEPKQLLSASPQA